MIFQEYTKMTLHDLMVLQNAMKLIDFVLRNLPSTLVNNYSDEELNALNDQYNKIVSLKGEDYNNSIVTPFVELKQELKQLWATRLRLRSSFDNLYEFEEESKKEKYRLAYEQWSSDKDNKNLQNLLVNYNKKIIKRIIAEKTVAFQLKIAKFNTDFDRENTLLDLGILLEIQESSRLTLAGRIVNTPNAVADNEIADLTLRQEQQRAEEVRKLEQTTATENLQVENARAERVKIIACQKLLEKSPLLTKTLDTLFETNSSFTDKQDRLTALYAYLNEKLVTESITLSFYQLEAIIWCYRNMEITPNNAEKLANKCCADIAAAVAIYGVKNYCPILPSIVDDRSNGQKAVFHLATGLMPENANVNDCVNTATHQYSASQYFGYKSRRAILGQATKTVSEIEVITDADLTPETKTVLAKFKQFVSKDQNSQAQLKAIFSAANDEAAKLKAQIIIAALEYLSSPEVCSCLIPTGRMAVRELITSLIAPAQAVVVDVAAAPKNLVEKAISTSGLFSRTSRSREKFLGDFKPAIRNS